MLEPEPNRYDELKKIHAAAIEKANQDTARERDAKLQAGKSDTTHDVEAHMAAFEKELDVRMKIGQIDQRDKIYLLKQEENRVHVLSKKDPSAVLEFPKPKIDAERLLTDKDYRREIEGQEREARQIARNGARPHRTDSDGRGR